MTHSDKGATEENTNVVQRETNTDQSIKINRTRITSKYKTRPSKGHSSTPKDLEGTMSNIGGVL